MNNIKYISIEQFVKDLSRKEQCYLYQVIKGREYHTDENVLWDRFETNNEDALFYPWELQNYLTANGQRKRKWISEENVEKLWKKVVRRIKIRTYLRPVLQVLLLPFSLLGYLCLKITRQV